MPFQQRTVAPIDDPRQMSSRKPAPQSGQHGQTVDDVAQGHIQALERGAIGQNYILGGQDVTLRDLLAVIAQCTGRRPPRLCVPRRPLFPLAYAAEAIARRTGKEPFITADGLRMAKHRMFFSSAKAERELGYRARPYASGIADAILWFQQAGYIR